MMDINDFAPRSGDAQRAPRAPVYRSEISEHFQGDFPIFVNRWEEGFALKEHDHAYLEIVYVMSGEGFHYVGDRIERTNKGCLYLLPVGTSHMLRPKDASAGRKLVVYNLCIRPAFVKTINGWLAPYATSGDAHALFDGLHASYLSLKDRGMRLGQLFERLHREYTARRLGYEASLFAGVMELTVELARLLQEDAVHGYDAKPADSGRIEMAAIFAYIDLHAAEPLTVDDLASQAGMSNRHFIRKFQAYAGVTFSAYVQLRRIESACRLLLESEHKVSSIAMMTGYRDLAYFRQVFRSRMGMSPSEYRKGSPGALKKRPPH
ncbi:AraC family transcriptional regulator [Cohnella sp. OV330]|uniref:AraC family transcriptional regulator n=1 Tax=Cohnella sp. OV330 TaxID=1855288 RepID=UPI000B7D3472|nr:AraC family transcriptional regulator [Cohnella sp. OV330]